MVAWRGGAEYEDDPFRSLIDIARARRVLGWAPRHTWPGRPT
jgi:nucleoside-diphosphate-sugar epimerase